MKKILSLALALVMVLTLGLTGCGKDEPVDASDVTYIKEKGTLIVGITDFAPMDYQNDAGEWIGFDADMAKELAKTMGVEVEFVEIDWDNKIMELDAKSIDCVWNGMTLTPETIKSMETTNAYAKNGQVVVVAADKADQYTTEESLKDLAFAVEAGSAGEGAVSDLSLNYTAVSTQADALLEVSSGSSDACVIDLLMAGAMIGEGTSYPDLAYTVQLTSEDYGIGCRKGSDLAALINSTLVTLYSDGTIMDLANTYGIQEAVVEQK